ncbi:hypothetical protein NQ317_013444, partial [Molorchus minor]
ETGYGCHTGWLSQRPLQKTERTNEFIDRCRKTASAISPSLHHLSPLQNAVTEPRALIVFRQLKLFEKTCFGAAILTPFHPPNRFKANTIFLGKRIFVWPGVIIHYYFLLEKCIVISQDEANRTYSILENKRKMITLQQMMMMQQVIERCKLWSEKLGTGMLTTVLPPLPEMNVMSLISEVVENQRECNFLRISCRRTTVITMLKTGIVINGNIDKQLRLDKNDEEFFQNHVVHTDNNKYTYEALVETANFLKEEYPTLNL